VFASLSFTPDRDVHENLASEVRARNGSPFPRAILGDLAAAAEQCNVVVVFADGYDREAIRLRIEGLDRWSDGPALLVVSDRDEWTFAGARKRPALAVPASEWIAKLILVAAPAERARAPVHRLSLPLGETCRVDEQIRSLGGACRPVRGPAIEDNRCVEIAGAFEKVRASCIDAMVFTKPWIALRVERFEACTRPFDHGQRDSRG